MTDQQTSASVYFVPRAKLMGGRFERGGDICLLMDYAFPSETEAGYWGTRNWLSLHAFGFGYEGVEKIDPDDKSPFPHITGRALGIGSIVVIGGPRWEKAFAQGASARGNP